MGNADNRRKYPRIAMKGKLKFSFIAFRRGQDGQYDEDIALLETYVRDISLGGISFDSVRPFPVGQSGYIFMRVEKKQFALTGEVIRSDKFGLNYQVGIVFQLVKNADGTTEPAEETAELMARLSQILQKNPEYSNTEI